MFRTYSRLARKVIFPMMCLGTSWSYHLYQSYYSKISCIQNQNRKDNQRLNKNAFSARIITSAEQLSPQDIKNKKIVCFQLTNIDQIDQVITQFLAQFQQKYGNLISEQFQIALLKPQDNGTFNVNQLNILIFKSQDYQLLDMKKYIVAPESTKIKHKLFKKLYQQINDGVNEVTIQNVNEVITTAFDRQSCHIVLSPKDGQSLKKYKKKLKNFVQSSQFINKNAQVYIIRDERVKAMLGLNQVNQTNFQPKYQDGQIYLIAPKDQNMILKSQENQINIMGKQYEIVSVQNYNDKNINVKDKFIFPPFLPKSHSQTLILKATFDLNQQNYDTKNSVYQSFKQIAKTHPQVLRICSQKSLVYDKQPIIHNQDGQLVHLSSSVRITLQKNNFGEIVAMYQPGRKYKQQEKLRVLSQSGQWLYTNLLTGNKLNKWIQQIKKGPQSQIYNNFYYPCQVQQPKNNIENYSQRIVAEQYEQLLNERQDKVVFHYSKNCHSCKKFGGEYQQLAKAYCKGNEQMQKILNIQPLQFYRIDNDHNKIKGMKNYDWTPIFVLYRKKDPIITPFLFKHSFFNKKIFMDFLEISRKVQILPQGYLSQLIKNHASTASILKDFQKV